MLKMDDLINRSSPINLILQKFKKQNVLSITVVVVQVNQIHSNLTHLVRFIDDKPCGKRK